MPYKKCRECKYRCRCCASRFFDQRNVCGRCENHYDEFHPAMHVVYCPLDGERIQHPLMDINGNIVRFN